MPTSTDTAQPFASSLEHLLAELERIDLLVRVQVTRMRAVLGAADPFQGLYVGPEELERLLNRAIASEPWFHAPHPAPPAELLTALTALRTRVDQRLAVSREPMRLVDLARRFSLGRVELDLLLIALAPEIDLRFERLYAWLQDDLTRRRPSVDLCLNLLFALPSERLQARRLLAPGAPLLQRRLMSVGHEPARPDAPLLSRSVLVEARVVEHLLGSPTLDPQLHEAARLLPPHGSLDTVLVPEHTRAELRRLMANLSSEPLFLAIGGPPDSGRRALAAAMASGLNRPILEVDLAHWLKGPESPRERVTLALREVALQGAIPCWLGLDALPAHRELSLALVRDSLRVSPLAFGTHSRPWSGPPLDRWVVEVELPRPDLAQRQRLWQRSLAESEQPTPELLAELAASYRIGGEKVRDAVSSARGRARSRGQAPGTLDREDLFAGARRKSEAPHHGLAQRVRVRQSWDDLVLPGRALRQLRELTARVRYRATVQSDWAQGEPATRGRGLHALFAGPSGTGKTMAAGIIAEHLGVDLLRVDLAQVVSKYIGETEKHLAEVFDAAEAGGAVLFFDEADALFGKRTVVQDAHDRYANIQVSYLLQRMEDYEGLCVLASNLRTNLDEAFVRRLTAIVEFTLPDDAQRASLWTQALGAGPPMKDDVDLAFLGRFPLSGGNIANVVTSAAYAAAANGSRVEMRLLVLAVADELRKMGRPCLRDDFGSWYGLLDRD